MARRPRKHHEQLELAKLRRKRDKNDQWRGGARKGAGRPRLPRRASEHHKVRERVRPSEPVHVVMRATADVGSLRTHAVFRALREAAIAALKHEDVFHIVHVSIQRTHIHMLVEAVDRLALAKGMQAFTISAAKHINAFVGTKTGERRRGSVFTDRYHPRNLTTPREVRNCIAYVLNNWRHHGEHRKQLRNRWKIDPYSTALAFDGWKERDERGCFKLPDGYRGMIVWFPKSWLLRVGWRRHGLVSITETPGGGDE
jgi:putative transposase